MADAADLTAAAELAEVNMQGRRISPGLNTAMNAFNAAWPGTLNPGSVNDRTVLNWLTLLQEYATSVTDSDFEPDTVTTNGGVLILRLCYAAIQAQAAGRITVVQSDNILTAYNAHIG